VEVPRTLGDTGEQATVVERRVGPPSVPPEALCAIGASRAPPSSVDLKAFVPAKDYGLAKQFYLDLGFKLTWGNDEVAEFEVGSFRFLLQNFYVPELAENFMMHLMVDDADAWWKHIAEAKLEAKYSGIMTKPPVLQPWGLRVVYLSDPTGVLWHIADRRNV
jgi:hypothetical protein